ncbi:hypothetical protein [Effusibacillus pohliae]|uniref:hypothetical protein n=1 Tax=Effusibacillus pohliae TaxID=232270 RepID=UPI000372DFC4|nr:hypothetical protein [Effusibacillus pohliae]
MSRIRLLPTLLFFAAALTLLFGGWILYRDYGLVRPLKNELTGTRQVSDVEVKLNGPYKTIEVSLNKVPDLQTAYHSIKTTIGETLAPDVTIKLVDRRTPELESLFQSYQPMIYEGIAKGSFTDMIEKVQERGAKDGLDRAMVTMDHDNLYIQLEKGDRYLYEVIPYAGGKTATPSQGVKSL